MAGIAVFCFGLIVVFIADHAVRPVVIGGAARLPFLWVLLGILGGLESFGIIGLFLGPAIMAALISLWRDWTEAGGGSTPRASLPQRGNLSATRPEALLYCFRGLRAWPCRRVILGG